MIMATATNEESLVPTGSTKHDLVKTLGVPFRTESLAEPIKLDELRNTTFSLKLLVHGEWQVGIDGEFYYRVPLVYMTEKAYYRFIGKIQKEHDVGEAVSLNLMTFGLLEPLMAAAALKERATQDQHIFTVWFDKSGKAVAYQTIMQKANTTGSENE